MKKIIAGVLVLSIMVSCTRELGSLKNISLKELQMEESFELVLKQQSYTANTLESAVELALKSVPKATFLKNTAVSSKGKKITIITDVWAASKKKKNKNQDLRVNKFNKKNKGTITNLNPKDENLYKFKEGMRVQWSDPNFGDGSGMITVISGNTALLDKVVDADGQPKGKMKLPLKILKPAKRK